jgi:hypothetical protein
VIQGDQTSKLDIVYALAVRPSVQLDKDHKTKKYHKNTMMSWIKGLTSSVDLTLTSTPFRKAAWGEMVVIRVSDI